MSFSQNNFKIFTKTTTVKIGRYISYLLRHAPRAASLEMNPQGYVSADALIAAVNTHFPDINFSFGSLVDLVENDDKQRYTLVVNDAIDDNIRSTHLIRANQGHSFEVDLGLVPLAPPFPLYHGTAMRSVSKIAEDGIEARSRTYVHLSSDADTAKAVGERHGHPAVLLIDTKRMLEDGYVFYKSENDVWLTDYVPPQYITKALDGIVW